MWKAALLGIRVNATASLERGATTRLAEQPTAAYLNRGLRQVAVVSGCGAAWFGWSDRSAGARAYLGARRGAGDVMVDGSIRGERLRPLGLWWTAARGAGIAAVAGAGRKTGCHLGVVGSAERIGGAFT
jgi:hypothetical protein